jgi:hypothetical protein
MSDDKPPLHKWRKAIDPRLVDRCMQHQRDGQQLLFRQRVRTYAATPRLNVTPEDWGAGYLREPREFDPPPQLVNDLHQCSPQSLLRDLYRPVMQVHWHRFETIEGTELKPLSGVDVAREARRVMMIAPRIESAMRTVIAFMYWRIGLMTEAWQPHLPDDAPRRSNIIM